jgi:hypothetical protein
LDGSAQIDGRHRAVDGIDQSILDITCRSMNGEMCIDSRGSQHRNLVTVAGLLEGDIG